MTPTAGLKTCIWTWCRASMLTTANTQTDEGGGMSGHDRKEIWSLSQLCSLSHPSHSSLHPLPIARLSTPLVMTMLQTALLSLGALLEPRCNSAKKASAWGREWSFLEEIDNVWSSTAPRRTLALLRLRHPAGKGAEVAGRGCGGLWQEKTLQKTIHPSKSYVYTVV